MIPGLRAHNLIVAGVISMSVILIVEDDNSILDLIELTLQEGGYETLTAGDVEEAVALISSMRPIDVLFTDICLKSKSHGGCEVARLAIEARPRMAVLYTTANAATSALKTQFLERGRFLPKPYTQSQLLAEVAVLLAA
jgi:CheY-like chemotaxis protein